MTRGAQPVHVPFLSGECVLHLPRVFIRFGNSVCPYSCRKTTPNYSSHSRNRSGVIGAAPSQIGSTVDVSKVPSASQSRI